MSLRIMFVLYLTLVALVAVNTVYISDWPLWADAALLGGTALALAGVVWWVLRNGGERRRANLVGLQVPGTIGLVVATGTLVAPAWQVLATATGPGVASAGRMAPMFITALALYGANLWFEAALARTAQQELERLARLFSGPRLFPAFITALLLNAGLILAMDWIARDATAAQFITQRFLERGIIPPITVLLFLWGLLLLLGKQWNIWYLRRALQHWHSGAASAATAPVVASLKLLGTTAGRLEESIALLRQRYEESYLFPRYISWAVPVLGFIGTVLGISLAADGIRRIIGSDAGLSGLSSDLSGAIAPLGIAFDTTLIALSLSVVLTLLLSLVQREEERVLATLEWQLRDSGRAP